MVRIKTLLIYILCVICLITTLTLTGVTVSAAETNLPEGFLIGDNDGIHVSASGDYFIWAEDMYAGDVITKKLTIHNMENDKPFSLYMSAQPLFSEGHIDLLDKISLELKLNGQVIYTGRLYGDEGVNMIDNALALGKYSYNDSAVMDITLILADDISPSYFYDKSIAEIGWKFTAIKDEEAAPPKTGEAVKIAVYVLIGALIIAMSILLVMIARKKRKTEI